MIYKICLCLCVGRRPILWKIHFSKVDRNNKSTSGRKSSMYEEIMKGVHAGKPNLIRVRVFVR
jgi:hypothetical protein